MEAVPQQLHQSRILYQLEPAWPNQAQRVRQHFGSANAKARRSAAVRSLSVTLNGHCILISTVADSREFMPDPWFYWVKDRTCCQQARLASSISAVSGT